MDNTNDTSFFRSVGHYRLHEQGWRIWRWLNWIWWSIPIECDFGWHSSYQVQHKSSWGDSKSRHHSIDDPVIEYIPTKLYWQTIASSVRRRIQSLVWYLGRIDRDRWSANRNRWYQNSKYYCWNVPSNNLTKSCRINMRLILLHDSTWWIERWTSYIKPVQSSTLI